jgi:hypothetical protein
MKGAPIVESCRVVGNPDTRHVRFETIVFHETQKLAVGQVKAAHRR